VTPAKIVLVYQGGIANVFEVDCFNMSSFGRNARRVVQGVFRDAMMYACGMDKAGCIVRTAACNKAGDIANEAWFDDLESQPFADKLVDIRRN